MLFSFLFFSFFLRLGYRFFMWLIISYLCICIIGSTSPEIYIYEHSQVSMWWKNRNKIIRLSVIKMPFSQYYCYRWWHVGSWELKFILFMVFGWMFLVISGEPKQHIFYVHRTNLSSLIHYVHYTQSQVPILFPPVS